MEKRYRVTLTELERDDLRKLISVGKAAARKLVRARILLLADQSEGGSSKSDPEIVESLSCGRATVERIRKQFVEEGLSRIVDACAGLFQHSLHRDPRDHFGAECRTVPRF